MNVSAISRAKFKCVNLIWLLSTSDDVYGSVCGGKPAASLPSELRPAACACVTKYVFKMQATRQRRKIAPVDVMTTPTETTSDFHVSGPARTPRSLSPPPPRQPSASTAASLERGSSHRNLRPIGKPLRARHLWRRVCQLRRCLAHFAATLA